MRGRVVMTFPFMLINLLNIILIIGHFLKILLLIMNVLKKTKKIKKSFLLIDYEKCFRN